MTWLKRILVLVVGVIIFRTVAVDVYYVPTKSMEGMIARKSYIVVNKLSYGPKLPRSLREIAWISWVAKTTGYNPSLWKNTRAPGLGKIERFDVVLGEYDSVKIVKRVMGLPGEQIAIVNSECHANGARLKEPATVQLTQTVSSEDVNLLKQLKAASPHLWKYQGGRVFEITASASYFRELSSVPSLKVVPLARDTMSAKTERIFPSAQDGNWNYNDYGAIHIPKAGQQLKLTAENWTTYCSTIEKHEGVSVDCTQSAPPYLINNEARTKYTFLHDYYFLMGDNRMNSIDSRFLGFTPDYLIFGRIDYPRQEATGSKQYAAISCN